MNKKIKISSVSVLALSIVFMASPVFAQTTTTSPSRTARVQANISKMSGRSDTEIAQRINSLNMLINRVSTMQKLSDTEKGTLTTSLQNEISQLTTLKAKIDSDTVASTLRTDMQSIVKSYRIYMLVLPQASIAAAADRILAISELMNGIQTKIQTRLSQLPTGTNTTSIQSVVSDITSKLADANTQANAAVNETSTLVSDQGNTTVAASNLTTLKDARNKIKTAQKDLITARKDFTTILQDFKNIKNPASTN